MLKLYGHYGSQPTRSVAWLLKMKKTPFEFITINPTIGEARTPEYRKKFPLGLIPAIEDTDTTPPFALSEASSIMIYLCEKYGWDDFYPTSRSNDHLLATIRRRAKINEYISHHNESTRIMTRKIIFPTMKWIFSGDTPGASASSVAHFSNSNHDMQKTKAAIRDVAKRFQHKFLVHDHSRSSSGFIVEGDTPTIADLLAYPDLAQIPQIMGINYKEEWQELEPLSLWMDKMSKLPCHDDVHRTVNKIGKMYRSKL